MHQAIERTFLKSGWNSSRRWKSSWRSLLARAAPGCGHRQEIFYLWRPVLRDPGDDLVLELAVASQCTAIVTFNERHFVGSEAIGLEVLTPRAFLDEIGETS